MSGLTCKTCKAPIAGKYFKDKTGDAQCEACAQAEAGSCWVGEPVSVWAQASPRQAACLGEKSMLDVGPVGSLCRSRIALVRPQGLLSVRGLQVHPSPGRREVHTDRSSLDLSGTVQIVVPRTVVHPMSNKNCLRGSLALQEEV